MGKEFKNIHLEDAQLKIMDTFLDPIESDRYFKFFMQNIKWAGGTIKIFGKEYEIPRMQAWYGDKSANYSYSGLDLEPLEWLPEILEIKTEVENYCQTSFNSVLFNLYRNGKDSNGWHSDNEKELGPEPIIASISLGQERPFKLKHKTKDLKHSMNLSDGSLLLMEGSTQKHWKHCIPKSSKMLNPRINLTFRRIFA